MKALNKILVIFVLLAVIVVGCKQGQNQNTQTKDNPIPQNTEQQTQTQEPNKEQPKKDDASSELKKLFDSKTNLEWTVTYNIVTKAQGQEMKSTMIQYLKGINKIRTDITIQGVESRSYFINSVMTSCTKMSAKWNCFKIEVPKDDMKNVEEKVKSGSSDYSIVSDGTKQIAGVTAKCYKLTGAKDSITTRYCYSAEGIPLYVYYEGPQVTSEMTALTFEKVAKDSVFEIPAGATTTTIPTSSPNTAQNDPCSACAYISGEAKDACLQSCGG